ncbi:MAG: hypothetical protein M3Q99_06880 [Acidobacteriota bacterium]|nr:hypothetical protein [Acidobacteriota bacterium]
MLETTKTLGKLQAVHRTSPIFLQRAAILAVVSFVFFLVMMVAFSIRQHFGYFLLATAFLIVQLFTLFGWLTQRKNEFKIHENGFAFGKKVCFWDEIESIKIKMESRFISGEKIDCEVLKTNGEKIKLSEAIGGIQEISNRIDKEIALREKSI